MSCAGNSCGGKNCSTDAIDAFKASENDVIEITTIPTLPTKKCRLIATLFGLSLQYLLRKAVKFNKKPIKNRYYLAD